MTHPLVWGIKTFWEVHYVQPIVLPAAEKSWYMPANAFNTFGTVYILSKPDR